MGAVLDTVDALVSGATDRVIVDPEDARSGATFERFTVDGHRRFLKVLSEADDWVMRITGNDRWELKVWEAGIYDRFPPTIGHAIVAMACEPTASGTRLGILMDDCGPDLIPPGSTPITGRTHAGFIGAMAALHATFWGWTDDLGLCSMQHRLRFFAPDNIAGELAGPDVPGPVAAAEQGWGRLGERSPELWELVRGLHDDPTPVTAPLAGLPVTFLSGDWKIGNLGHRADGTTILLDQAYPGSGPACWDLLWYLALNRDRLPESKEATIDRYRAALDARGVDTGAWWDEQVALTTIAMMACFGWEKALGDDDELEWWTRRTLDAATVLG